MSQHLTLELSDEIYAHLQQKADAVGISVAEWIIASLHSQSNHDVGKTSYSVAQQEEARQKFRNHAGAISLGYATGVNNESIDADLARAYATEYGEQD
jgi:hypothetical protein